MSSRVTIDSSSASILHSTTNTVHPAALDTLTFTNYSPRKIQACLDSTIMTYLQQQQHQQQHQQQYQQQLRHKQQLHQHHQPPPLPPQAQALIARQQLNKQRMHKQQQEQLYHHQAQHYQDRSPTIQHNQKHQLESTGTMYHQAVHKHETSETQQKPVYQTTHPGASAKISALQHSSRDQTKKEEPNTAQGHLVNHDQAISSKVEYPRVTQAVESRLEKKEENEEDYDNSYDDDEYYDDDDDDISEYSDEDIDESDVGEENSNSDSDKTETEPLQQHNSIRTPSYEAQNNGIPPNHQTSNRVESQHVSQEHIRPSPTTTSASGMNGEKMGKAENHINPTSSRILSDEHEKQQQQQQQPKQSNPIHSQYVNRPEITPNNVKIEPQQQDSNDPSSTVAPHMMKARMVPYVEEEDEDGGEEQDGGQDEDGDEDEEDYDDDEISEEYDEDEDEEEYDEDEDEEDYSYSEDEDEDEDGSVAEYGEDSRTRGTGKPPGQYPHSRYYHYRPRLDVNFLQKRDITKQVVRRSSLTALLGEVSQPEVESRNFTMRPLGSHYGQYQRHNGSVNRRPTLPGAWAGPGPLKHALTTSRHGELEHKPHNDRPADVQANVKLNLTTAALNDQHRQPVVEQSTVSLVNTQVLEEPHRPRRTDSGVEVKISPILNRDSVISDNNLEDKLPLQIPSNPITEQPATSSPQNQSKAESSSFPSITSESLRRSRIMSESDIPEQGSSSASGSNFLQVPKPLKSSISCQTFPRAAGKRTGQKHVSWHHSLFPVERSLRVKPSIPSLSCVPIASANATLSQLPSVPEMTKDNVESFHQSIRSLRTVSRIEIAKMSYKQQGRQELTSPVPISKSVHGLVPWWNPARWLKGPVVIDKRHWKPDNSRESCAFCFAPFNRFTNPRHHCRKCGDLFCGKCASAEILMDAKNCVYVQQSQLARWSRRVDLQRHSLWIDTLPQLHPVRTAVESGLVVGSGVAGMDGHGSVGHAGAMNNGLGVVGGPGSGRHGSWQMAPGASKKSRLSIFGLFSNGAQGTTAGDTSDSTRSSLDNPSVDNIYSSHYGHLQPHSQNPLNVTFSLGRRPSSSSVMRSSTAGTSSHLLMSSGSHTSTEGGLTPIAMSRRKISGGVGEVCLARICVGCERELLKPVPRCTSIAKYYGSLNSRGNYRPSPNGYSSLGPYMGRQHTGPLHPMDHETDPDMAGNHDYNHNGVRRHSPLRQVSHMANVLTHEGPSNGVAGYYNGGVGVGQGYEYSHDQGVNGWNPREEPVGPHGGAGCHPSVLTFQEQQLQYTQQTQGPLPRELS